MNNLYGLVLCGGQSSRMGTDKGLIQHRENSWLDNTHALLKSLPVEDVFVSINADQVTQYQKKDYNYIIDGLFAKGPLNGLLSAHVEHPRKDFFVLACDMQLMNTETLLPLHVSYEKHNLHCDAFIYKNEGYSEPLCGIYTHHALQKTLEKQQEGTLKNFSLKGVLDAVNTYYLSTETASCFHNFNTEEDIIQLS